MRYNTMPGVLVPMLVVAFFDAVYNGFPVEHSQCCTSSENLFSTFVEERCVKQFASLVREEHIEWRESLNALATVCRPANYLYDHVCVFALKCMFVFTKLK